MSGCRWFISRTGVLALALLSMATPAAAAAEPDWSEQATVGPGGRENLYAFDQGDLETHVRQGRLHALHYPVAVTGVLLPFEPVRRFLASESTDPLRSFIQRMIGGLSRIRGFEGMEAWLGLHPYPANEGEPLTAYHVPFRDGTRPERRMGMTVVETEKGRAFTISCAQCHTGNLFGRQIIGMTNRFPRANRFFAHGLSLVPVVTGDMFRWSTEANAAEADLFERSLHSLRFVGAKRPVQLGLDTSLAQVALSLARRDRGSWAERDRVRRPRPEPLSRYVADSKPAVWWNVKYKTRWLSDGSVVSGNPIVTNLLWNEIGRGTDLHALSGWLDRHPDVIRELTSAVFHAQAPRFTDFFDAASFPIDAAMRGERLFIKHCAGCHGIYQKAWHRPDFASLDAAGKLATTAVVYKEKTEVKDVGTDPQRYIGMRSLEQLNDLEISKRNGVRIVPQKGYVPPPLVGIWARWPYFHNNSVPSLCAVLTRAEDRPMTYWARDAADPNVDFDTECNGYPMTGRPPEAPRERFFDTRREGLSNSGHDEGIFLKNGQELMSVSEKRDLIRFLQTL